MIEINWDPIPYLGFLPVNWYGITMALGFLVGGYLTWRAAPRYDVPREKVESLLMWIIVGTIVGARAYFLVQNDFWSYLQEPWRMLMVWEGGLAFFGGLFGATAAAFLYTLKENLSFARVSDLFAPAIPIGAAIGRTTCGLAGMDYGTPTALPWGVVYTNPNSYAPADGISRHPVQFYELFGDLIIAGILFKLRGKLPDGALFTTYLVLFGTLRFFLFFARGDVPEVALGMKNGQLTALAILAVAVPVLAWLFLRRGGAANREQTV
jgi:phosphatidylglycerol---prolipoprotein diacylglyceryl transferase